jgi:nitroreductase
MEQLQIIKSRRSVRTFDRSPLSQEHFDKLRDFTQTIQNPYGIPVEFRFLEKEKYGLSSPVISGESHYVAAKVQAVPHSEEAFGYAFEQLVLYAWSLGIGTTWIGGTMKRSVFEQAVGLQTNERMYCVSPLGYPAKKMSLKETAMRVGVQADKRRAQEEIFFQNDFNTPLGACEDSIQNALDAVRFAPSAVNKQPCRIVRCGNTFHFYEKHSKGYVSEQTGDMQKIDMGIALCHFVSIAGGNLILADPGIAIPGDTEYIATVVVS